MRLPETPVDSNQRIFDLIFFSPKEGVGGSSPSEAAKRSSCQFAGLGWLTTHRQPHRAHPAVSRRLRSWVETGSLWPERKALSRVLLGCVGNRIVAIEIGSQYGGTFRIRFEHA